MSATLSTPEKTVKVSDEMINAFLTLVSLTNKFTMPEIVARQPVVEYELLMNALIDEYNNKL
ncbi:MAG: hypothetical protein AB9917_20945 [Negativicutes bacterium]